MSNEPDVTVRGDDLSRIQRVLAMLEDGDPVQNARLEVWFGSEPAQATIEESVAKVKPRDENGATTSTAGDGGTRTAPAGDGAYPCDECDEVFDTSAQLRGHLHVHRDGSNDSEADDYPWLLASEDPNENEGTLRGLRVGTAEHEALTIICEAAEAGAESGIPVSAIKSRFSDHNPSNMSGAGIGLYRALLVERRRNPEVRNTGWEYEYRPTPHGVAELDRAGPYTEGRKHEPTAVDESIGVAEGTGRHQVLTLLADAEDHDGSEPWMTTNALREAVAEDDHAAIQPQSAGPTAYDLVRGGWAVRRAVPKSSGHGEMYEYRINDEGRDRLDSIGWFAPELGQ